MQINLFKNDGVLSDKKESYTLADRMRPTSLDDIVGQSHLIGKGKPLRDAIDKEKLSSMILWGPPGSGKTTLAYAISKTTKMGFLSFSAVLSGINEIKTVIKQSEQNLYVQGQQSILFVDEIHRFNKLQQDAFLPFLEKGVIILIGATTENPSFELISPLLSRTQVFILKPLQEEHIITIMIRALDSKEHGFGGQNLEPDKGVLEYIASLSGGDARYALNIIEFSAKTCKDKKITMELVNNILQREHFLYDKSGEEHYNLISALHKCMRDSDPDAALYWLGRMLEGGEDRLYIARRMVRFAAEDIGLADPQALQVALSAKDAYHFLGTPEGEIALAEVAIYLSCAPKSNSVYTALSNVTNDIKKGLTPPVPLHLRNAPTKLMKEAGYSKGYKYAHNYDGNIVNQSHLPGKLKNKRYYIPTENGRELKIKERLERWRKVLGDRERGEKK
ncbi:replication-associated recombination protein A [bacterium]|nr:replication-associated recombination protein A [bacterium]